MPKQNPKTNTLAEEHANKCEAIESLEEPSQENMHDHKVADPEGFSKKSDLLPTPIRKKDRDDQSTHETGHLTEDLPITGRIAGVDFGTVRIGLATCDPSQQWVTPYDTYNRRNLRLDAKFFSELAQKESLVGWVIGLPIHCDGKESQKSTEVRKFAEWLGQSTGLPYLFYDERFSTREARRLLQDTGLSSTQKKKRLDRLAAHIILTHYLDARANLGSKQESQDPNATLASLDDSAPEKKGD